jgi:hypothetical protein
MTGRLLRVTGVRAGSLMVTSEIDAGFTVYDLRVGGRQGGLSVPLNSLRDDACV